MNIPIFILSIIGLIISLYSLYLKIKLNNNPTHKPICDINKNISCTKALSSKYSSLLKIPNSIFGLIFYSIIAILSIFNLITFIFYIAIISIIISLYLAMISYIKMKNFCIICTMIYIINILILISSYQLLY